MASPANRSIAPFGVLTFKRVSAWMGPLLAIVTGLSVLVGYAAEGWDHFNWEVASIFGTALGTTALAAFTGALAFATSGDVRATWRLAELTQEDQEARQRPMVMALSTQLSFTDNRGYLQVQCLNVGLGPAIRLRIEARYDGPSLPEGKPEVLREVIPALGVGLTTNPQLLLRWPGGEIAPDRTQAIPVGGFRVTATYEDRIGRLFELIDWSNEGREAEQHRRQAMLRVESEGTAVGTEPESSQARDT